MWQEDTVTVILANTSCKAATDASGSRPLRAQEQTPRQHRAPLQTPLDTTRASSASSVRTTGQETPRRHKAEHCQ